MNQFLLPCKGSLMIQKFHFKVHSDICDIFICVARLQYLWRLSLTMNLCSMDENKPKCKRGKSKFAVFRLFSNDFVWKSAHFCIR